MAGGKVFGTSGEVRSLAKVTQMCMKAIEETNVKGNKLLHMINGAESDAVYGNASEIVAYVTRAVQMGQEPLESVIGALNAYADLLESHGK